MLIAEFVHVHRNLPQLFAANGGRLAAVTDHGIQQNFKRSVSGCVIDQSAGSSVRAQLRERCRLI